MTLLIKSNIVLTAYIYGNFAAVVMVVMSYTKSGLNRVLNICYQYCVQERYTYNPSRYKVVVLMNKPTLTNQDSGTYVTTLHRSLTTTPTLVLFVTTSTL